jgi:hypothetical protein
MLVVSVGAVLDLDRVIAYAIIGLKVGGALVLLALIVAIFPKESHEKTVWRDRTTGKVVGESPWIYRGLAGPNLEWPIFALVFPLTVPIFGVLIAAVANSAGFVTGLSDRYAVSRTLNLERPNEQNRISHGLGFSIVVPAGWTIRSDKDGLGAFAPSGEAALFVGSTWGKNVSKFTPQIFQGRPAWVDWHPGDPEQRYSSNRFHQKVVFEAGERYWHLHFEATNFVGRYGPLRKEPMPILDEYLATFKLLDRASK